MTIYQKPGAIARFMNSAFSWLASRGLGPRKTVTLEVKGRRSGEPRAVAVNTVDVDGQRYLVAPRGNTEWARNVRAAGGEAVIRRGKRQPVHLEELPVEQRAPIIQAYLKENALVTKREFGIEPSAPLEDFQRIAPQHPVFRIENA
jgi:deazaflavin-dependent oxidoreductase (nitroreductase family)